MRCAVVQQQFQLVGAALWRRLQAAARPSLKALLLADDARANLAVPPRGRAKRRKAPTL